ncbi:MAG TPA: hypothetical protein VNK43_01265, partial [Gemmatimonadales bacterium]|nr:hypothetical protein [Gemmatimonadales bacterium]
APRLPDEAAVRELDLAFYRRRVASDPYGAADRAHLAALYLRRAQATGSDSDLRHAEAAARASLARRSAHNQTARQVLASALMGQHRFAEALEVARALAAEAPEEPVHRSLVAENLLELGRYAEAAREFGRLGSARRNPVVALRLARWAELRGRIEEAFALRREARRRALARHGLPREQRAWFHLQVGELALRYGRLREAHRAFQAGLAEAPGDHRLLAAQARLEAARGRWHRVVTHAREAWARAPEPATLAQLGEAYAALGDSARAERCHDAFEAAATRSGTFERAWAHLLLDHGRRTDEVLEQARRDIRTRRDVHGYDLVAWALYRNGRLEEARAAMDSALALGTREPTLLHHAAAIARAAGDTAAAGRFLTRAAAVAPGYPVPPAPGRAGPQP